MIPLSEGQISNNTWCIVHDDYLHEQFVSWQAHVEVWFNDYE